MARRDLSHPSHICCTERGCCWLIRAQATPKCQGHLPPLQGPHSGKRSLHAAATPLLATKGPGCPPLLCFLGGLQPRPQPGPRHALQLSSSTPAISSASSIYLGFSAPAQYPYRASHFLGSSKPLWQGIPPTEAGWGSPEQRGNEAQPPMLGL